MKNIEKFPSTKDALDEYNRIGSPSVPFNVWLDREYEEPPPPTLIEAAEAVKNTWNAKMPAGSLFNLQTSISNLADAIDREKSRTIRNCDRCKTAKEAYIAFLKMCKENDCITCPYKRGLNYNVSCRFSWLYDKLEKDEEK